MHHLSLTHQCKDTDNKIYNPLRNLSECLSQVERYLKALSGLNKLQSFEISRLLVAILIKIIFALVHSNEGLLGMFQVERYLEALIGLWKVLKYHVLALQYWLRSFFGFCNNICPIVVWWNWPDTDYRVFLCYTVSLN